MAARVGHTEDVVVLAAMLQKRTRTLPRKWVPRTFELSHGALLSYEGKGGSQRFHVISTRAHWKAPLMVLKVVHLPAPGDQPPGGKPRAAAESTLMLRPDGLEQRDTWLSACQLLCASHGRDRGGPSPMAQVGGREPEQERFWGRGLEGERSSSLRVEDGPSSRASTEAPHLATTPMPPPPASGATGATPLTSDLPRRALLFNTNSTAASSYSASGHRSCSGGGSNDTLREQRDKLRAERDQLRRLVDMVAAAKRIQASAARPAAVPYSPPAPRCCSPP